MPGNDAYTKLLIHANEADTSTTPADSSASVHTITAVGNAQVDTAQYPPLTGATGSLLFDGTGDYLSIPTHADFAYGTGDFTVDFWTRFTTVSAQSPWRNGDAGNNTKFSIIYRHDDVAVAVYLNTTAYLFSWSPTTNTWYHVAVTRSGTSLRAFVDGTQIGSTQTSSDNIPQVGAWIGNNNGVTYMNGWIGEYRESNIARWTANFTPSTVQYSPDSTQSPRSMHQFRLRRAA